MSGRLHAETGRRIMAGTLSNLYVGLISLEQCLRGLRDLARFARAEGSPTLADMCEHLADELDDGGLPSMTGVDAPEQLPEMKAADHGEEEGSEPGDA